MSTLTTFKKTLSTKGYSGYTPPTGVVLDGYSSSDFRGRGGHWFFGKNGVDYYFKYEGHDSAVKAYEDCAPVNAIINRKAQAYINGKTLVLNSKGKEATSEQAKKLKALFKKPNLLQSWEEFEAQGYIYQQLFGYNIILIVKPSGYTENIDASALWNIPPFMVNIEETKKLFYQVDKKNVIQKIILTYKGEDIPLKIEDIYIMKDFVPSMDSLVLPESRLCALARQVNNIIGAYESRNVLINYRGALGILSNEIDHFGPAPISEKDKEQLQTDFKRYGLKNNQWQFIVTSASLKWQAMGYPTKDLMLFEEIEDDIMRICDSYNFPYVMMSSGKGTTFSNMKEAKQVLYQDATIPESLSNYGQLNQLFNTEKYNITIFKDYSHIPVLQANKVEESQARKTLVESMKIEWEMGLLTWNQMLEKLGEETIGPAGDIRITDVKTATQPLAVIIGVGGVQSIVTILTANLSEEAKRNTLEILFGIPTGDAARMVVADQQQTTQNQSTSNEVVTEDN